MATAFKHELPEETSPLARASGKLALVTGAGLASMVAADPAPSDDRGLLAAWDIWRSASKAIEDSGPEATEEEDAPFWAQREALDPVLTETPATTIPGALAKLRFLLASVPQDSWALEAILAGDDATLFARVGELDFEHRVVVDAMAALSRYVPGTAGELQRAIAAMRDLNSDAGSYTETVGDPARAKLLRALKVAEDAVPHATTVSSYDNHDGERRFMTTERPAAIHTARHLIEKHGMNDDDEFSVTCREGVAILDQRERLIEQACDRVRIEHGIATIEAEETQRWRAVRAANDAIVNTRCASVAELLAKFDLMIEDERFDDEDTVLALRADIHRLAVLSGAIQPTRVRQAFETWVAARIAYDAVSEDHPNDARLFDLTCTTEATLAATPAETLEDMLFKLLPLAMGEHGSDYGEPTFALRWRPEQPDDPYLCDQAWLGLINGMVALSPRISELVGAPVGAMPVPAISDPASRMADYLRALDHANADEEVSPEEHDRRVDVIVAAEKRIRDTPAVTADEALMKCLLVVQMLGEGHEMVDDDAKALAEETIALIPGLAEARA